MFTSGMAGGTAQSRYSLGPFAVSTVVVPLTRGRLTFISAAVRQTNFGLMSSAEVITKPAFAPGARTTGCGGAKAGPGPSWPTCTGMAEPTASKKDTFGRPSTAHVDLEMFVARSVTIPVPVAALAPMPPMPSCDEAHAGTATA
jgi:hypothetical protein